MQIVQYFEAEFSIVLSSIEMVFQKHILSGKNRKKPVFKIYLMARSVRSRNVHVRHGTWQLQK